MNLTAPRGVASMPERRLGTRGLNERKIPVEDALPDEIEAIEEGQAQIARGEYVLLDDSNHETGHPTRSTSRLFS
jgi:hypothetical protein